MDLVGYSSRLSVAPGEDISFMVSARSERYRASLVKLICGDDRPDGPGFKEEHHASELAGEYPGRYQPLSPGSYVVIPASVKLDSGGSFTVAAWIWPTTPSLGRTQAVVARWSPQTHRGYSLFLNDAGHVSFRLGDGHNDAVVSCPRPLRNREWYLVAGSFDAQSSTLSVRFQARDSWANVPDRWSHSESTRISKVAASGGPLLFAAESVAPPHSQRPGPLGCYNGKIDGPMILNRSVSDDEFARMGASESSGPVDESVVGFWNFADQTPSVRVRDISDNSFHGSVVNMPMRACTGHRWTGSTLTWPHAPAEYSAIHFHEDDLEDAGWDVDFQFRVPQDLKSGVYAVKLTAPEAEDYLPFVVRPHVGTPTAPALLLLPTFSYLAYANEHKAWLDPERAARIGFPDISKYVQPQDRFMLNERLLSLYEKHSDGSGVAYSSALRPLLTVRPKYDKPIMRAPHEFNADLYVVDWLEQKGFQYDVATDGDLHESGKELLASYRVVLTGTHPEYWTGSMLDGLAGFLAAGGRLMYLGGNGFYWVTSVHPERPHVIEVRRGNTATRAWSSEPGECYHSTTGEPGGIWRDRGRAPQKIAGVGSAALGADKALPYTRQEASFDERFGFIFDGLAADVLIGEEGRLLGGAAGFEIDRYDYSLGSPPHAVILATASGYSDHYLSMIEEAMESDAVLGGTTNPNVRADMVYFSGPRGGAVFSVGSMAWASSLFCNSYDNPVSRITENVLSAFIEEPRASTRR